MKTKLLITIRKFYDYKFLPTGKLLTRNKSNGIIREYNSIEEYVHDISYTDTFIHSSFSIKWNKKKLQIKENRIVKEESYWNSI